MNEKNYTSLGLSKKLAEAGCTLYPIVNDIVPSYDILNDICCLYAKEFFGDNMVLFNVYPDRDKQIWIKKYEGCAHTILNLLQQGKTQEVESYIWENCKFNPNNQ